MALHFSSQMAGPRSNGCRCERGKEEEITGHGELLRSPLTRLGDATSDPRKSRRGGVRPSQWCCESCAGADADVAPTGSTANSTSTGPAFANISVASNGLPCWIGPLRLMIIRWNELGLSSTVCPGLISRSHSRVSWSRFASALLSPWLGNRTATQPEK